MTTRTNRLLSTVAVVALLAFAAPYGLSVLKHGDMTSAAPVTLVPAAEAAIPTREGIPTLAPLIEKVTPAVVNVAVKAKTEVDNDALQQIPREFRRFFEGPNGPGRQPRERNSAGSGVIVDAAKGYVLTNNHVVDDATEIVVTLKDRREFIAKVIGKDEGTDIAVLQIDAKGLQDIPLGDSSDLRVGDYVVAIGNPFGLSQTVTSGIVSALGRSMNGQVENYEDFIQTDASINPGNSGGALINLKGELVGINTAIIGPSGGNVGIGFAVPTSMAKSVMTQLIEHGEVSRGRLGIVIANLSPDLARNLGVSETEGALVSAVNKDSPAEKAGLKAGDVVTALNGGPIRSSSELRNRVGMLTVGTTVDLTVVRDGSKRNIKVAIAKIPGDAPTLKASLPDAKEAAPAIKGASFADPDAGARVKGVVVTEVEEGSIAARSGLQANDVVVSVNRKPVKSVEELAKEFKDSSRQTVLFVKRDGEDVLVVVQ